MNCKLHEKDKDDYNALVVSILDHFLLQLYQINISVDVTYNHICTVVAAGHIIISFYK